MKDCSNPRPGAGIEQALSHFQAGVPTHETKTEKVILNENSNISDVTTLFGFARKVSSWAQGAVAVALQRMDSCLGTVWKSLFQTWRCSLLITALPVRMTETVLHPGCSLDCGFRMWPGRIANHRPTATVPWNS